MPRWLCGAKYSSLKSLVDVPKCETVMQHNFDFSEQQSRVGEVFSLREARSRVPFIDWYFTPIKPLSSNKLYKPN